MPTVSFTYTLLHVGGVGHSPAEQIAANFPTVTAELGKFRGTDDGRFLGLLTAPDLLTLGRCLASLAAWGATRLTRLEARTFIAAVSPSATLPGDTTVDVFDDVGRFTVTFPLPMKARGIV